MKSPTKQQEEDELNTAINLINDAMEENDLVNEFVDKILDPSMISFLMHHQRVISTSHR